ncbi:MAG: hypothetical protein EOM65_11800 [Synergistales bacterium]|nr:hypothetical protein [Synergistales bacterium]
MVAAIVSAINAAPGYWARRTEGNKIEVSSADAKEGDLPLAVLYVAKGYRLTKGKDLQVGDTFSDINPLDGTREFMVVGIPDASDGKVTVRTEDGFNVTMGADMEVALTGRGDAAANGRKTFRQFLKETDDRKEDIDVNVDGLDGMAYVGGSVRLTPEGEKVFGDALDKCYMIGRSTVGWDDDDTDDKDGIPACAYRALDFLQSAAGYCSESLFKEWFVELDEDEGGSSK